MSEEWLEHLLNEKASLLVGNEIWMLIFLVVTCTNKCLRILYRSGVWLPAERAKDVARLGLRSLGAYKRLADIHVQLALPSLPLPHKVSPSFPHLQEIGEIKFNSPMV